jgi:hypothetical protein
MFKLICGIDVIAVTTAAASIPFRQAEPGIFNFEFKRFLMNDINRFL